MELLLLLLAFPLIWPWIAKSIWHTTITWPEMAINIVLSCVLVLTVYGISLFANTADTEVWNGQITGKEKVYVSCEHSYSCNCVTVSCGKDCTTQVCQICYDHSNDWDWRVRTDIDEFNINRIDRRGSNEPPRWTVVQPGQPYATTRMFKNYIKATPESLFHQREEIIAKFPGMVPLYPNNVYDYHYVDRVMAVKVVIPDLKQWNNDLALMLRELGPRKQANVIIVFVNTADQNYYHALEAAWLGGKKNDVVIIIGTTKYPNIEWARVLSWTDNQLYKVELQDALLGLKLASRETMLPIIRFHTMKAFKRKNWKDFDYLSDDIQPSTPVVIFAILLGIISSVGCSIFMHRNDEKYFTSSRNFNPYRRK